jgi:hypothetical protein
MKRQQLLLEEILAQMAAGLVRIERRLINMALDQATFDTDLASLIQAITDLDTAVEAWIGSHPATDLTSEDQAVQAAAAAVTAELANLTPAPVA